MDKTEALMVLDNERIQTAMMQPTALDQLLQGVRERIDSFKPSIETDADRKAVASMAYKIARTKTAIDMCGKDLTAKAKAEIKKIDVARKRARDTLDAWKDEVRAPLTEWENRREESKASIARMIDAGKNPGDTIEEMDATIKRLEECDISRFCEEMQEGAEETRKAALISAHSARAELMKIQAEREELEALRKEKEEREAAEMQAARDKAIAEKAAQEAEARLKREQEAQAEQARRREQDAAHRKQVVDEIVADIHKSCSISETHASAVCAAICKNAIRHVSVTY